MFLLLVLLTLLLFVDSFKEGDKLGLAMKLARRVVLLSMYFYYWVKCTFAFFIIQIASYFKLHRLQYEIKQHKMYLLLNSSGS